MTGPLTVSLTGDTAWMNRGACARSSIDMFPTDQAGRDHAKAVCEVCPVREECAGHELANRIDHGIWGGLDERERRAVLRKAAG